VSLIPRQEPEIGVTIILLEIELPPTDVPVETKLEILPTPLAPKPILVLSLLQLKIVPGEPAKLIGAKLDPSQTCWSETGFKVGNSEIAKSITESFGQLPFVV